jgi:hypothetical protein
VTGKFIDDKISDFIAASSGLKHFMTDRGVLEIEREVSDLHVATLRVLERFIDIGALS